MRPYLIGITGGSGSGKTTFIRKLRASFSEEEVCIVSLDDYYKTREEQKSDDQGVKNFDRPKSIDRKELVQDLRKLMNGEGISRIEYTFNNEKKDPKMLHFRPAPIIIVEGLFVLHFKKVRKLCDLKVFVQAKENIKVIRRIRRDRIERNYPIDDVLYRYQHHVLPAYERYIKPYLDEADIILNNNHNLDRPIDVMVGFIRQKLAEENAVKT